MTSSFTESRSAEATRCAGVALAPLLEAGDVLLLTGDLGAGKTQLVKGIAVGLGVAEPVTSPTFNILLVHEGRLPLYHIDLYRLERPEQLEDIDWWGVIEGDGATVVEWGDRFAQSLPAEYVAVTLHILGDNERRLEIAGVGTRGLELAGQWLCELGENPGAREARTS